ncbi:hypothetical protein QN277_018508 [Acacia crassicarpa]|uniref:CHY-type domain-containing protein n=1 Tax=Acacia crassicarpa TaxID=499986 RepID=A0AAE1MPD3_9FABA|nr:hypothetical protein QN277_018508 [Acacia crassicarpa]
MDYIVEPQMLTQGVSQLDDSSLYKTGSGHYGCSYYRRRCRIIAPCCNEIFDCRNCHN